MKSSTPSSVLSLAFRQDSKVLAAGQENGTWVIWITKTFNTEKMKGFRSVSLHAQQESIRALDFSRTKKYLASESSNRQVVIYNVKNGSVYKRL